MEILRQMTSGGMGLIYLARDGVLQRQVVLKRPKGALAKTPKGRARFLREARSMARIEHRNVLRIYHADEDEIGPFIEMEYIEGGSLFDKVRRVKGGLPFDEVAQIGIALCGALDAAHSKGIFHRDIKPGNVLLTSDGVPMLADFGLAAAEREESPLETSLTMTGAMLGTPYYVSPEQARDAKTVDARSDIYSLGATLYFAATGEEPRVIRFEKTPEAVRSVLEKALEENPESRFPNAVQFAGALEEAHRPPAAKSALGPAKSRKPLRKSAAPRSKPIERVAPTAVEARKRGQSGRPKTCAGCGSPLEAEWKACPQCGRKTGPSASCKGKRPRHTEDVQTCFVDALESNDYETAQDMLDQGAEVDGECEHGYTALWSACVNADVDCVKWLLRQGADPNQEYGIGGTPLENAALGTIKSDKKTSSLKIMKLLIEAGADVNHVHNELSIWDLAGSAEAQRLLERSGAKKGRRGCEL